MDDIFLVIWRVPFFSHIATECVFSANLLVLHLHNTRPGHAERHKAQSHWRCQSEFWDRKMLNHFKSRRNEMYDKGLQPIGCFGGCWMNSLIPLGQRNPSPSFPWGLSKELRNELTNFMEARLRLKAKLQKETALADLSGMNMHVLLVFSVHWFNWFPAKTMSDVDFGSPSIRDIPNCTNCIYEWQAKERCSGWECTKKMDLRPRVVCQSQAQGAPLSCRQLQWWEGTNTVENRHYFGPQYSGHCILLEGFVAFWPPILMKRRGYCCNKPKFIVKKLIPPIHQYKITHMVIYRPMLREGLWNRFVVFAANVDSEREREWAWSANPISNDRCKALSNYLCPWWLNLCFWAVTAARFGKNPVSWRARKSVVHLRIFDLYYTVGG